jgi:Tol biopolymer transport system component
VRPITEAPEAGLASDASPAVSPDGTVVAFQRSVPGESPHIYVVGIDGTGLRRLTEGPAAEIAPAWSPDGTRIAFSRAVGDRFDLVVSDADGSRLTRLTQTPNADEDGASWSPNGAQLVFTRFARDDEDLWVIDVDGANAHALVRGPHEDSSPAWAADGARIALVRDGRIALLTFERFEVEFLTPAGPVKEAGPSWSPDGKRIVFTRDPGTILVVDADGAKATPVPFDGQATGGLGAGRMTDGRLDRRQLLVRGGLVAGATAVAGAGGYVARAHGLERHGRRRLVEKLRGRRGALCARSRLHEPHDLPARVAPATRSGGDRAPSAGA